MFLENTILFREKISPDPALFRKKKFDHRSSLHPSPIDDSNEHVRLLSTISQPLRLPVHRRPPRRQENRQRDRECPLRRIPQQGAQTGGYSPSYIHLSHIPLFPLYSSAQLDALGRRQHLKELKLSHTPPPLEVKTSDKLLLSAMSALPGGTNPLSVKKWVRRLQGFGAVTLQKSMEQTHTLMFTRWTAWTVHWTTA